MKETKFLPSFGGRRRMKGVPSERKIRLREGLLPALKFNAEELRASGGIVNFEIGSGNGETVVNLAEARPSELFIACEVYGDGIASTLGKLEERGLKNIRFFTEDARLLLEEMPEGRLANIYVLFPDPWPKARHHKRRLINAEFLDLCSRKLCTGGMLNIATDDPSYQEHILLAINGQSMLQMKAESPLEALVEPSWWVRTKYQQKALNEGRTPMFFIMENTRKR